MGALPAPLFLVVGTVGLSLAAPATAAVVELRPTTNWAVDYADDSCALYRSFGHEGRTITMEMRQFSPDHEALQFIVKSDSFQVPQGWYYRQRTVRFAPVEQDYFLGDMIDMRFPDGDQGATFSVDFSGDGGDPAAVSAGAARPADIRSRLAATTAMELSNVFSREVALRTGSLAAPLAALGTCLEELQLHWGIDVEAHRTLSRRVVPRDMEIWSREIQESYSRWQTRLGRQAIMRIRLAVSTEGRASECHVQARLGNEDFERMACEILLRSAVFEPALDAQGEPLASYYILAVHYRLG